MASGIRGERGGDRVRPPAVAAERITIVENSGQPMHPLPRPLAIAPSCQLQLQLLMQQVHGQSPGLHRRRLIQSSFNLIGLLELICIEPLRRPASRFACARRVAQQLQLHSHSVAAEGRFMQSQLIQPIALILQRLIRE